MTDPTIRPVGTDGSSGTTRAVSSGPGQWAPKGPLGQFLVYGAATAFAARLMALVAGIASQIFFARLIPPEALGAYFLTQSVVIMGANLGEFGLNRPIARVIAVDIGENRLGAALRALRSAVGISTVTGLIVIALFVGGPGRWLCLNVFDSELMANTIGFTGIWIAVRMVSNLGSAVLQGLHRVGLSALLSGSLSTTFIAVICGLLLLTETDVEYETIIAIATGATAASAAIVITMVWAAFSKIEAAGPPRVKPLMISTFPIFAAGILQVAAVQADLWIVGAQLQAVDVALYGAAKRLTTLVGFPVMVLSFVVPPMISELYSRGEAMRLQRLIRAATTAASIPASAALAIFVAFGTQVLTLAYGDAYAPAATVLRILCAERIVFILLGPGSLLLVMTGHERSVFRITMVSATTSLLAIYLGGRFGGLVGVALGYSISSSLSGLWFFLEAHRQTGVWTHISPLAIRPMLEVVRRMTQRLP